MSASKSYINLLQLYLSQLKGDNQSVKEGLVIQQPDLNSDSFYIIGTWVWLLQKQIGLEANHEELMQIDYQPYVTYLCEEWGKPHPRVWNDGSADIYLSNLAIAYASLLETKNCRNDFFLQKTITEIRDYVFDYLLSGGMVLNGVRERTISADQVLSVLPYGLFSPEDLVMVETAGKIRMQLDIGEGVTPYRGSSSISVAATALMGLYYLEKSERESALHYYDLAKSIINNDDFGNVLLEIFNHYALAKNEKDRIIHEPLGNENVYITKLTERKPHYPLLGEPLKLVCQVVAEDMVDSVILRMENQKGSWKLEEHLLPMIKDGTTLFKKRIEPLPFHEPYTYYFVARLANGQEIISDTYEVSTLKNHEVSDFRLVAEKDNELVLVFGESEKHQLSLSLKEDGLNMFIQQNTQEPTSYNNKTSAYLEVGDYRLDVGIENPSLVLSNNGQKILSTHPLCAPIEWKTDVLGRVSEFNIHWYSPDSEQFYGFGERYNATEQRGEVIDCYVYNQYRDQGTRTYIPIPFYMTNSGYGCFVNTYSYTKFDLASELKDKCTVTFEQGNAISETMLQFYFGSFKDQVVSYTRDTGKPQMVPAWALGPWMSSNNWDRQSIVDREVQATIKHNIPATVMVLEQWSDEATYYMFNDATYELKEPDFIHSYDDMGFPEWGRWPDPKRMVEELHANHLKLILWQIPIQKYLNKQQHPLKDQDETYMINQGYLVKNADGTPYRIPENWYTNSMIMDFSNEEGRKWWFDKRQYLIDIGVDGFKTDGGEFVFGKGLQFADGKTGSEMRNKYANDYIQAYYDFAQQNGGITFSRAGYTGAQNSPAHWAGDERSTFDAFKRSLIAGINAGLAGIVFWGWDLAGFNGEIPTAELFMRSASMAAFCPIMQYHAESKAEFNQDRTPWNIAERTGHPEVIDVYRFFANVRMNLMPYIYQEAKKASDSGIPIMRALMLDYPNDSRVRGLYDQYMFGESLLIAPIIEEEAISRKVYLPKGKWVDLWTDHISEGPWVINSIAHVDQIPVFVKMNQAILMNVDSSKQLGSSVGNDITNYNTALCKVYCDSSFDQTLYDHLGNTIRISVKVTEEEVIVNADTNMKDLEWEVICSKKTVRINNIGEIR